MPDITIASWNIEHMHNWFDGSDTKVASKFKKVAQKVGNVIKDVNPHILCVQEGPSFKGQLQKFVEEFVGGTWNVVASHTKDEQRPYIAYQKFAGLKDVEEVPFNVDDWKYPFISYDDKKMTWNHKTVKFTRLPVELIFNTDKGSFAVICLHLKSKISFASSYAKSTDSTKRTKGISEGLEQRARILQEATLLRKYIQNYHAQNKVKGRILVMGDLNDGPGMDFFEKKFFSTDLLRRIRGDIDHADTILVNLVDRGPQNKRFSAIFYDKIDKELRSLLLDHILVTPNFLKSKTIQLRQVTAKVQHNAYLKENDGNWSKKKKPGRKQYPSDHRPVSVKIKL